eukprot:3035150-Rhodomonas_salina.2
MSGTDIAYGVWICERARMMSGTDMAYAGTSAQTCTHTEGTGNVLGTRYAMSSTILRVCYAMPSTCISGRFCTVPTLVYNACFCADIGDTGTRSESPWWSVDLGITREVLNPSMVLRVRNSASGTENLQQIVRTTASGTENVYQIRTVRVYNRMDDRVSSPTGLRTCYGMSGTEVAYAATRRTLTWP